MITLARIRHVRRLTKKSKLLLDKRVELAKKESTEENLKKEQITRSRFVKLYRSLQKMRKIWKRESGKRAQLVTTAYKSLAPTTISIVDFNNVLTKQHTDILLPNRIVIGPFVAKPLRVAHQIELISNYFEQKRSPDIKSKLTSLGLPTSQPWNKRHKTATVAIFEGDKPIVMVRFARLKSLNSLTIRSISDGSLRAPLAVRCYTFYALLNPQCYGASTIIRYIPKFSADIGLFPKITTDLFPQTVVDFFETKLSPAKIRTVALSESLKKMSPTKALENEQMDILYFTRGSALQRFNNRKAFLEEINKPENINKLK